ncbi:MAG: phosphohistidine phosphatase SixA [Candidatus Promineifilaceae bacterium]|nr:phosphohistidine phosphatase SixA [Candidatus Promineifilaceae bacterium]
MSIVYLVQHGQAKGQDEDPDRPLTATGRQETERIAALVAKMGLSIAEIRHSGKTRARETAAIFARALKLMGAIREVDNMDPTDDVRPLAESLVWAEEPLMLVGHKPFLPSLAGQLINGDPVSAPVKFRHSGIVAISPDSGNGEHWLAAWQLNPL